MADLFVFMRKLATESIAAVRILNTQVAQQSAPGARVAGRLTKNTTGRDLSHTDHTDHVLNASNYTVTGLHKYAKMKQTDFGRTLSCEVYIALH